MSRVFGAVNVFDDVDDKWPEVRWEQLAARNPDLIVVGGGVSKDSDLFLPKLRLRAPIVPAVLRNKAGIIGAARLAVDLAG